jgi:hypothetical protein
MKKWIWILFLWSGTAAAAGTAGTAPEVGVQWVGTEHPTSFPKLLLVHLANPGYTPFNLKEAIESSVLLIDGKPSKRTAPFHGIPGLPPIGEWDGCLAVDDYVPGLSPGKHKVSLKLGKTTSEPVAVRWPEPINWRQGTIKSRKKEIEELAKAMPDGLPQNCVEHWLTVKDGGTPDEDKVRYFVEPQFKVTVPYRQMYQPSGYIAVVDGPAQVYEEAHSAD